MTKKKQKIKNKLLLIVGISFLAMVVLSALLVLVGYQKQKNLHFPDQLQAGFKRVKDLRIGDWVYVKEGEEMIREKITGIEKYFSDQVAYNLKTEGLSTFFANDFAVHNKGQEPRPPEYCGIRLSQRIAVDTSSYFPGQLNNPNQTDAVLYSEKLTTVTGRQAFENSWIPFSMGGNPLCYFGFSNQSDEWEEVIGWPCTGAFCSTRPSGVPVRPNYQLEEGACPGSSFTDWYKATCSVSGKWGCPYDGDPPPPWPDRRKYLQLEGNFFIMYPGSVLEVKPPNNRLVFRVTFDYQRLSGAPEVRLYRHGRALGGYYNMLKNGQVRGSGSKTVYLNPASEALYFYHSEDSGAMLISNVQITFISVSSAEGANGNFRYLQGESVVTDESYNLVTAVNNSIGGLGSVYVSQGIGRVFLSNVSNNGPWTEMVDRVSGELSEWTPPYDDDTYHGFTWDMCKDRAGGCNEGSLPVYIKVCGITDSENLCIACSDSINYTPGLAPTGTITGNVYQNDSGACNGTAAPPSGWVVECGNQPYGYYEAETQLDGTTFRCKAADGSFNLPQDDTYIIRFKTVPADWSGVTNCSQDSVTLTGDSATAGPLYLWQENDPWFQTWEGDVHAGGSINSPIPDTADDPYFSLHDGGETSGVISYGGNASFGEGKIAPDDEPDWQANDNFSRRYFDYFYQLLGSPEANYDGVTFPSGTGVYYSGEVTEVDIPGLVILPPDQIIVLVKGNVRILGNIEVENGASLIIIASGDIRVDNSTVRNLQGIFISDGTFATGNYDVQLTARGVFIAQEFALERGSVADPLNNTEPYETFYYRPDLVINSHPKIWSAVYTWQEIAP